MKPPRSLQGRLGLSLGLLLACIWLIAAGITAVLARNALDEEFDAVLQETAQRLLPLAVADIIEREEIGVNQRLADIREHDELLTYVVRDDQGRLLLQSHDADPALFPEWSGTGFEQNASYRFYNEEAVQGTIRITIAEPLAHRLAVTRDIQWVLGLPLLVFLPVALLAIALAVRASLAPLRRFRGQLAERDGRDLSLVPANGLPPEIAPVAHTLNEVLARLSAAFEAERTFTANAAHELRTPLAAAIAQVQRLQTETADTAARARAADIEATLKRLTRLSERLMQLARAEGGQLRRDQEADLRPVAQIITQDLARSAGNDAISLSLPAAPLRSDLDPDIFAILCRNLVENALRHGSQGSTVNVSLAADGTLTVVNDGPALPPDTLARLTNRFERAGAAGDGSGLGLAIVKTIAERIGSPLTLASPAPGRSGGFAASLRLPVSQSTAGAHVKGLPDERSTQPR